MINFKMQEYHLLTAYSKARKVIGSIKNPLHVKSTLNYIVNFYMLYDGYNDGNTKAMYDILTKELKAKELSL